MKLVNPLELQNILRNVTSQLPESYELVAGSSKENMHLYYELTKVSVVANVHSVNLVLTVPLKTTDSNFTLFRLIALEFDFSKTECQQLVWMEAHLSPPHTVSATLW